MAIYHAHHRLSLFKRQKGKEVPFMISTRGHGTCDSFLLFLQHLRSLEVISMMTIYMLTMVS